MRQLFGFSSRYDSGHATPRRNHWRKTLLVMVLTTCLEFLAIGVENHAIAKTVFQPQVGDRIAIMGNGLPDRMQHDGWLEVYLQARFPTYKLSVRNLGFTGDELTTRLRSAGFGSPEDWLQRTEANVVLAFFGYNESFRDEAGLKQFKHELANFINETRSPPANSTTPRRLVLFSPTAYEDLQDPLLPSPTDLNRRLSMYTKAMEEVADELEVTFVNLFQPTLEAGRTKSSALTINGVHFNEAGNRAVAKIIDIALFGKPNSSTEDDLAALRETIQDKNFYWFQRYRTTDGFSIFGGRKSAGGGELTPENGKVMQREMEVLDQMTAHRDRKIWAVAQGKTFEVDDSNTLPLIPVATNQPGPLQDGKYLFLGGEEAIERMTVADGMEVNLFASEETFPELINPVQTSVDTKGRLWAAVWPSYPHWKPKDEMNDKLLIFKDNDGDGRADECKVFADGLHNPTGFEFYNGGVYVAQVPDIWFLKDTDGDDVADVRQRVIGGIDSADTHHSANSFVIGPGGGLYFQEGLFHRTQIETPHGPPVRIIDAGVFRYDPRSQQVVPYANYGFANPHGHVFTYWGDDIIHDGTSAIPTFGPAVSGRTVYPGKHSNAPPVYEKRTRPCSATAILSSSHFPEEHRGNLLVCNVIGEQGVLQYKLDADGAGVKGVEAEPFIMSTDPNFRPVDLEVGADGAVYILDWQNPLIGHLQHNLRDSNRDHLHGRIYRVRCRDLELLSNPVIAEQPLEELFRLLENRDNGVRYRAKIQLSRYPAEKVVDACTAWVGSLAPESADYEHHLLEALWVHQHNHQPNEALLRKLLNSQNPQVRAASAHVLRAWREQVTGGAALVERVVHDEHPRVRLAGVLICSDLESSQAAELALKTAQLPRDRFLDYALTETTRTLASHWKQALADGKPFCHDNPEAIEYLLRCISPDELLKLAGTEQLLAGVVIQPNVKADVRFKALGSLSKIKNSKPLEVLLDLLTKEDKSDKTTLRELVELFAKFNADSLRDAASRFVELATTAQSSTLRQGSLAAIVRIDSSLDRSWQLANDTNFGLLDLVKSVEFIPDSKTRKLYYDRVRSVLINPKNAVSSDRDLDPAIESSAVDAMAHIPGHEVQKLSDLLLILEQNRSRANVIKTLGTIPQNHWQSSDASQLVDATIKFLATTEPGQRASGDAFVELQLALKYATLLPPEQRTESLKTLNGFAVRVLSVGTIPHRMAYDQQTLVVQAGKPAQLVFENNDNMPHNFVVTEPGFLANIGQLAESQATQPSAISRQYVPESPNVILASRLLQPEKMQTIDFYAPTKPGVYPFVCTYPGHWRRMFGALVVVDDVEAYEADSKQYLAANSIEPQDEMLKFNRPLREWTFAELKPALDRLATGQSFHRGSELFQAASCAACHTVQTGQRRFAPDLAKLDPKRKPEEILRSLIEPSNQIEKAYSMSKFLLDSGQVVVGLVIEETDEEITLMTDPLANCEPTILKREEIEEQHNSELSLMPVGLLDRFTEEEILELCAYVVSRGDENAAVYREQD